jgi:hypothetical protein
MADFDAVSILVFAGFVIFVLGAVAIAGSRDPNIRRKVTIVTKSGLLESFWVTKKSLVRENGSWWYKYRDSRYSAAGPQYQFTYRLVRSFGLRQYIGLQRIYIEGNPSPYAFKEDERMALLRDTARLLGNAADSDLPLKLLRPRKVDVVFLMLIGILAFAVGFALGGRV